MKLNHIVHTYLMFDGHSWIASKEFHLGIWSNNYNDKNKDDPRAKEYEVVCPHCNSEFRVWLKNGQCVIDCPAWNCGKSFVYKELIRPEYR